MNMKSPNRTCNLDYTQPFGRPCPHEDSKIMSLRAAPDAERGRGGSEILRHFPTGITFFGKFRCFCKQEDKNNSDLTCFGNTQIFLTSVFPVPQIKVFSKTQREGY